MNQQMNESRWSAYMSTVFRATVDGVDVAIRPGHREPTLDGILESKGVMTWAFITAWNPGSHLLSPPDDATRHLQLERDLKDCETFAGAGER